MIENAEKSVLVSVRKYENGNVKTHRHSEQFAYQFSRKFWEAIPQSGIAFVDGGRIVGEKDGYDYELWVFPKESIEHFDVMVSAWAQGDKIMPFVTWFYTSVIDGANAMISGLLSGDFSGVDNDTLQ